MKLRSASGAFSYLLPLSSRHTQSCAEMGSSETVQGLRLYPIYELTSEDTRLLPGAETKYLATQGKGSNQRFTLVSAGTAVPPQSHKGRLRGPSWVGHSMGYGIGGEH